MHATRHPRFESLEKRLALAVTATVTDGDLIVTGDADGAVQITAVGAGQYEVRDDGNLIADNTTLTGATDDIRIDIDDLAGADNMVTLDLGTQTVDRIYAELGNGANSLQVSNGTAASFVYNGGSGNDAVTLGMTVTGYALVSLGNGDNSLTVSGTLNNVGVRAGSGTDTVTISDGGSITGNAGFCLGNGDNSTTIEGSVGKNLFVGGGKGLDTVTLAAESNVAKSVFLALGNGTNTTNAAGTIGGSLRIFGRDGNDVVSLAATANITDSFFALLGAGDNTVTHNGTVGGNFKVLTKNANDVVTIADTAVIGGTQMIGVGQQRDVGWGKHGSGGPNGTPWTPSPALRSAISAAISRITTALQSLRAR
jgi:hypothetical protein